MAFIFPGDLQVGGDLNLATGSNIVLPSGSDIVLGEGANIQGQGDLDGNFSGSFTGSFTGSFGGLFLGGVISSSVQISTLGFSTESADMTEVDNRLDALEAATSSFLTTTGSNPELISSASHAEFAFTASHALGVPFNVISDLPDDLVSSSQQIEDFGFVRTTGSDPNLVQSASHAEFAFTASHALGVPFNVISDLPDNLVSSSQQVEDFGFIKSTGSNPNLVASSSHAEFAETASHALSVPFNVISDLPADLVSSSQQIEDFGFITASVSGGIDYDDVANKPTLVSGSQQIIDLGFVQTTGSDPNLVQSASHAEFAFTASHALGVPFNVISDLPTNLVSSSQQVEDFGFIKSTGSDPNLVQSASHAEFAFTASHALGVPFNVISDLPDNLVSSSQQVEDFGFVKTTGSNPNLVQSSSHAEFAVTASYALTASRLDSFTNVRTTNGQHALLMTRATSSGDQDNGEIGFAGTNTSLGSLKFNPNRGGNNDAAELTIGAVGVKGILDLDRIDMNANLIIDDGRIDLLGVSNGGYIRFSNVTLPNALVNQGTLIRNGGLLKFSSGSQFYDIFFQESQIDIGQTTGNISGSRVVGDIQASSVDYDNVLNKPTLFSSSAQIDSIDSASFATTASFAVMAGAVDFEYVDNLPDNLLSSSQQVEDLGFVKTTGSNPNLVQSSSHAEFAFTASHALSVPFNTISDLPDNLVSASSQITLADTTGNISGSRVIGDIAASSVDYDNVNNKPTLFSASNQVQANDLSGFVHYSGVTFTTSGHVSGSSQIDLSQATGTAANATSASYASNAESISFDNVTSKPALVSGSSQVVNLIDGQDINVGEITATSINTAIVTSSVLLTTGSNIFGDESTDTHEFTGSVSIKGDFAVEGLTFISSSQQITDFGFVKTTGSNPNLVQSSSHAEFANSASMAMAVDFDAITGLPDNLVSSSAQVTLINTAGNISASRIVGSISADTVDVVSSNYDSYQNLVYVDGTGNSKALKADSGITYNSSLDILKVSMLEGTAHTASYVDYGNIQNLPNLISGSSQITLADTIGNISGSRVVGDIQASSVDYANVNNKPALISSSAQIVSSLSDQDLTVDKLVIGNTEDEPLTLNKPTTGNSHPVKMLGHRLQLETRTNRNVVIGENAACAQFDYISDSVIIGNRAGCNMHQDSCDSIIIGSNAAGLSGVQTYCDAIVMGYFAAADASVTRGIHMGHQSGYGVTGEGNVFIGNFAGTNQGDGDSSIAIGNYAGRYGGQGCNIYIGQCAGPANACNSTETNKLYINNSYSCYPLIGGDFSANTVTVSGSFDVVGGTITGKHTGGIVSSSAQIDLSSATGTAANATSASFATTASFAVMAGAVDFTYVENLPDNLLSSSAQVGALSNVTISQDRTYNASLTFTGSRYIRYTDNGNTGRYAMHFDGNNNVIKFQNRAANGNLEFYANGATAGSGGEAQVADFTSTQAHFYLPISGSSITASIDASNIDGTVVNATSASIATTSSYVDMDDIDFSALTHYDDDTAAAAGGVPVGKLYRNGNFIQVRLS